MSATAVTGFVVRPARGDEPVQAGELCVTAYRADGLLAEHDEYEAELRDGRRRAGAATLLVAVAQGGDEASDGPGTHVVGTVTVAPHGSPYAEVAGPGEVEVRMLAVVPHARRAGIAETLVRGAMRHAVASGARRVVLSTDDAMAAAQRLYARLGFVADPARDWGHPLPHLRVHTWTPPVAPGPAVEVATWPPVRTVQVGEGRWVAGLSGGVTRRANSVTVLDAADGPQDLAGAVEAVEALYADAGLPSVFRVGPRDTALDVVLHAHGYVDRAATTVLVRALDGPSALPSDPGSAVVRVADAPDDGWLGVWSLVRGADHSSHGSLRHVLQAAPADYLTATDGGRPVAVVRAAYALDWVGVSCLAVGPAARRRGLGRALTVHALAVARDRGARRAFLQVEADNVAAGRLYSALGFVPADAYVYRERAPDAR